MDPKKPKIQIIDPSKDVIDSWRLLKSSITQEKWEYPSLSETPEEDVRRHHFGYMMLNQDFFGMMVKVGRRPVGQIIGDFRKRPIGSPRNFYYVYNFWIEPEFRKRGYMKALWAELLAEVKKRGFFHWEANGHKPAVDFGLGYKGYETKVLYPRIGGKI